LAQLRKCLLQLLETEVRAYSDAEVEDVLSMSAGAVRLFYWLTVETGMWAGELCGLRVCEIDPNRKLLRGASARSNSGHLPGT
jgi:integrase